MCSRGFRAPAAAERSPCAAGAGKGTGGLGLLPAELAARRLGPGAPGPASGAACKVGQELCPGHGVRAVKAPVLCWALLSSLAGNVLLGRACLDQLTAQLWPPRIPAMWWPSVTVRAVRPRPAAMAWTPWLAQRPGAKPPPPRPRGLISARTTRSAGRCRPARLVQVRRRCATNGCSGGRSHDARYCLHSCLRNVGSMSDAKSRRSAARECRYPCGVPRADAGPAGHADRSP